MKTRNYDLTTHRAVHDKAVRESRARHTQGMAKEERGGNQWLRRHHAPGGLSRSRVCSLGIPASSTAGRLPKRSVEDLRARMEMDGQDRASTDVCYSCALMYVAWTLVKATFLVRC